MAAPENMACTKSRVNVVFSENVLWKQLTVEWCFLELWSINASALQKEY